MESVITLTFDVSRGNFFLNTPSLPTYAMKSVVVLSIKLMLVEKKKQKHVI